MFPIPDEVMGEEVFAWVKLEEEATGRISIRDLFEKCRDQIAHFKVPKYMQIVKDFPMPVAGKPQKTMMTEHVVKFKTSDPERFYREVILI